MMFRCTPPTQRNLTGCVSAADPCRQAYFCREMTSYESGTLLEEIPNSDSGDSQLWCLCASTVRSSAASNRVSYFFRQHSRTIRSLGLVPGERPELLQLLRHADALCVVAKAAKL